MKELSVIVTAYNIEKVLPDCLDSIIAQGNCIREIIVVDDGSLDETAKICDGYASKYDIIKVIHQENKGISGARNAALDIAGGRYIAFVDGDDFLKPGMYDCMISELERTGADIVLCNYDKVTEDGKGEIACPHVATNECLSAREALHWAERPHYWTYVVVWNRVYKREIFDDLRFPEGKIHEDEFIFHKAFLKCKYIASISDSYYCYRANSSSVTGKGLSVRNIDGFDAIYDRFSDYRLYGYKDLLRGAIECAKGKLQNLINCQVSSPQDRERVDGMVMRFREMVRMAGINAGLLNIFIALAPRVYYRVRGKIKGC